MATKDSTSSVSQWRPWLVESSQLKWRGIVDALDADIRSGKVRPGMRLPPQRAIADALGVDLTTVTRAFNEAHRRGLIDAHAGRGTFVREGAGKEHHVELAAMPTVDLSLNIPAQPASARLQRRIPDTMAELLSSERGRLHLHYQESRGSAPDRAAAALWLARRVEGVQPSSIVLASGAQSALFAVCDCIVAPGEVIAAGSVTYPGLKAIAQQRGFRLEPLAMDDDGIVPESFEDRCRVAVPKAIYIIPAIDNPTTATMPEGRRRKIAAIARQYGVAIIEDDPYSPLLTDAPAPFALLAPDITWHIATLSKCVTPALRIAYVIAPGDAQALRLSGVLRSINLMAPPLNAALVSRWITSGVIDDIRDAIRDEAAARQKIARANLSQFSFLADPYGHHLWLKLPSYWRASDLAEHAARAGIAVVPGSAFAVSDSVEEAVRISLGAASDRGSLAQALNVLGGLLSQPAFATRAIV
jgi:DNA-binding transcriptional MocR family regulator